MSCQKKSIISRCILILHETCTGNAAPCPSFSAMRHTTADETQVMSQPGVWFQPHLCRVYCIVEYTRGALQTRAMHASKSLSVVLKIRFCMTGPIPQLDNPSVTRDGGLASFSNDQL
ncbi:hypothetical protein B0T18DRAFT_178614 [Schizothecium vesticola]|uniref:Uncharacterized protein n=1 Tax=Schizothecium vesticola TaxID=314040 RepID=A0AA40EPQ9_9PEZI|nr:hypothetical protein B0T18DRAFT_178614 [Schizothecium vesticola]